MLELRIGSPSGEHFTIDLPDHPPGGEDWFTADVHISINCFQGRVSANFQGSDFPGFRDQLKAMRDTVQGEAALVPLEGQFEVKLVCNALGQIAVAGTAFAMATYGSHLDFEFGIDQTFLAGPLAILEEFLAGDAKSN